MSFKFYLKTDIGGYDLPADFPCLNASFLKSLEDLEFIDRVKAIFKFFTNTTLQNSDFSNIEDAEFPASIVNVDESLAVLELFDGVNANYLDYIFSGENPLFEVISFACVIISAYVDLFSSNLISYGEKFNLCFNASDGRLALASWFCKLAKLPIETLILGADKISSNNVKGIYLQSHMDGEVNFLIKGVFDDIDYLLDPISAVGFVSYDLYYSDFEDGNFTVLLALASPYYFARQLLKTVAGINEISVDKAIQKINALTALEIPSGISSKKIQPFYKISPTIHLEYALDIIKKANLV